MPRGNLVDDLLDSFHRQAMHIKTYLFSLEKSKWPTSHILCLAFFHLTMQFRENSARTVKAGLFEFMPLQAQLPLLVPPFLRFVSMALITFYCAVIE